MARIVSEAVVGKNACLLYTSSGKEVIIIDDVLTTGQSLNDYRRENKQYLSDTDGLTGDGDHGINMNKGFTMCKEALDKEPGNMSASLKTLSNVLMEDIGGSMGPLYGCIFRAMFRDRKSVV